MKYKGKNHHALFTPGQLYFFKEHACKDFIWILDDRHLWGVFLKSQFLPQFEEEASDEQN
jgi:hypothetical protein